MCVLSFTWQSYINHERRCLGLWVKNYLLSTKPYWQIHQCIFFFLTSVFFVGLQWARSSKLPNYRAHSRALLLWSNAGALPESFLFFYSAIFKLLASSLFHSITHHCLETEKDHFPPHAYVKAKKPLEKSLLFFTGPKPERLPVPIPVIGEKCEHHC